MRKSELERFHALGIDRMAQEPNRNQKPEPSEKLLLRSWKNPSHSSGTEPGTGTEFFCEDCTEQHRQTLCPEELFEQDWNCSMQEP